MAVLFSFPPELLVKALALPANDRPIDGGHLIRRKAAGSERSDAGFQLLSSFLPSWSWRIVTGSVPRHSR